MKNIITYRLTVGSPFRNSRPSTNAILKGWRLLFCDSRFSGD